MRFIVALKCPDCGQHAVQEEAESYRARLEEDGIDPEEIDGLVDEREHEMQAVIERWLRNGEYLTVMLDTEKNTCEPIPVRTS